MRHARTLHEELAEATLDKVMNNPGAAAILAEWRCRFKDKDYDPGYVASIGQTLKSPDHWPLEQVAAFLQVHTGLMSGRYAHVPVSVGETPGPDADRAGNAAKLRGVHPMFSAYLDMHQNGARSDGRLQWESPIHVNVSSGLGLITDCGTSPVEMGLHVDPGSVPLEVGSSMASRTYLHLAEDGGVARWPYDSDHIVVLLDVARVMALRGRRKQAA